MCDRGISEDMYDIVQRDETTINALTTLHNHDYDCKRAIQALVKCPIPQGIDRKWSDEDQKKFFKGFRQYGKNFFRIRRDLLPHKQTSDLVEYYYLWKKTPQAQSNRPRRRQTRPLSTSVNLSTTPTPIKQRNNSKANNKDGSEHNSDNDDNQKTTTDDDEQCCQHCQAVSKDLKIAGCHNSLLCYGCRMYYKRNNEMPIISPETSPYLFKPLDETSSSRRKRTKPCQSPEENLSSLTRLKKKPRINGKVKTEADEDDDAINGAVEDESTIKKELKSEEQENEKPSVSTVRIKTEEFYPTIHTSTPFKQESNLISPNVVIKSLADQTKPSTNLLLSSASSAFSRTSKKSSTSINGEKFQAATLIGDVIQTQRKTDSSNDDGNASNQADNDNQELTCDEGPPPSACERECYNKSQGIILLQIYDRSASDNSCARTDIILKRGSRSHEKPSVQLERLSSLSSSSSSVAATAATMATHSAKHEDRNHSIKFPQNFDKTLLNMPSPVSQFSLHDLASLQRTNTMLPSYPTPSPSTGSKPSIPFPPPCIFFQQGRVPSRPSLDSLTFRSINPSAASLSAQSPFTNIGHAMAPAPEPCIGTNLFDPSFRNFLSPLGTPSSASISSALLPSLGQTASNNSPSSNSTHNHAHIHSHSHTHLHLPHNNDSPTNLTNGFGPTSVPPALPFLPSLQYPNQLSGFTPNNPALHHSIPSTHITPENMHNLYPEYLLGYMLTNSNRLDPTLFDFGNSFQIPRHNGMPRINTRERPSRDVNEHEYRGLGFDINRHFRFPLYQADELSRRF